MKIKFRGRSYNILFKHKFLPIRITEEVHQLYGAPQDYKLIINGERLNGKVALVTGAHKGIGFHIAMRLLKDGAKVIITGRNELALKRTIEGLNTPNAKYMVWDVADGNEKVHFKDAIRLFGKIDILVNNAGINNVNGISMNLENATTEYIHSMNDINVFGTVRMCEAFIDNNYNGTILNIVSNTAVRPATGIYWMTKWAVYNYTKGLSQKLANSSAITVNGLCPGPTLTDMMKDYKSSVFYPSMANKRIGMPEEIAELAFVQVLTGLQGKNGDILVCDGGESLE